MATPAEQRQRELNRKTHAPLAGRFEVKVVGVSFVPAYPDNLWALQGVADEASLKQEPLAAILIRNPDNPYDANAIEVHVPALGDEWAFIGHIVAPVAARLAPELDSGVIWAAEVVDVLINSEHMDRPGISIRCERKDTE
jgi:hypothetical protein